MSDKLHVGQEPESLLTAPKFEPVTGVELIVTDDLSYFSGDRSGRVITELCPWGSQRIADDVLQRMRGFEYQPFYASGVPIDPAVELGDALSIGGIYGGFYGMDLDFKGLYAPDVDAPEDEELDHEYAFESKENRQYRRDLSGLSTRITTQAGLIEAEIKARTDSDNALSTSITATAEGLNAEISAREKLGGVVEGHQATLVAQADLIAARVEKTGGGQSFSWALTDSSWEVKANNSPVFQILDGKTIVHGDIYADGGQIAGLVISRNSLTWNGQEIGMSINLGTGGKLTAPSGHFGGNTNAGNILHGDGYGTMSGSGLTLRSVGGSRVSLNTLTGGNSGNLALDTVLTSNLTSGIRSTLSHADTVYNVLYGTTECTNLKAKGTVVGNQVSARSNFSFQGKACKWGNVQGVPCLVQA